MSQGNPASYTASAAPSLSTASLPITAFGPYPLLGSDVFIDPNTKEAVIGPNGDLLSVNSLQLLAQDLRIRILTEVGELLLHPNYGFGHGKVIGSGQARPSVQAQIFRAEIMQTILAEPRVLKVLDVTITQGDSFSWVISYTIMAIGVEDPQRFNLISPYYRQ